MNLLIDTHVLLWIAEDSPQLSKKAKTLFTNSEHQFYLSSASIWELAIKLSLKKIMLPVSLQKFIDVMLQDGGIKLCPVKNSHVYLIAELPFHHRDPFDRLIISQAISEKFSIVSKDEIFKKYDIQVVW